MAPISNVSDETSLCETTLNKEDHHSTIYKQTDTYSRPFVTWLSLLFCLPTQLLPSHAKQIPNDRRLLYPLAIQ